MKKGLSSRILLPNLAIVIGSLLMLAAAMLITVRVFMQQETTKEFKRVRGFAEIWMGAASKVDLQNRINLILKSYRVIFLDMNILVLPNDAAHAGAAEAIPFPESELEKVQPGDSVTQINYGGRGYLATTIPYKTEEISGNLLLYTTFDKIDSLLERLALSMLAALACASLIAALASVFAARRIADPLKKLSGWARKVNGRQYGRFEHRSGTAEIDFLADSLNGMVRRLEEYDAAQKIFLQNASHELRTPLMSIQGYAEGIRQGVFTDTANAADIIVEESLRLSALVEDLLYMSKLETAGDFYRFEPISLGEVLGQCAEKLKGAAIKEGKTLTLLPCSEILVSGDGEKLLRAVMNLAGNCLRYAKTTVEMSVAEKPGRAVISVRDDGPGFDPQDLPNLFTRFYKGKQGKFGLGLSIARAITERHGGVITAANRAGGGAEFLMELPRIDGAKDETEAR